MAGGHTPTPHCRTLPLLPPNDLTWTLQIKTCPTIRAAKISITINLALTISNLTPLTREPPETVRRPQTLRGPEAGKAQGGLIHVLQQFESRTVPPGRAGDGVRLRGGTAGDFLEDFGGEGGDRSGRGARGDLVGRRGRVEGCHI